MSYKWERRENKKKSQKNRMPKHGMSVFEIQRLTQKRAEKAKTINIQKKRKDKDNAQVHTVSRNGTEETTKAT